MRAWDFSLLKLLIRKYFHVPKSREGKQPQWFAAAVVFEVLYKKITAMSLSTPVLHLGEAQNPIAKHIDFHQVPVSFR